MAINETANSKARNKLMTLMREGRAIAITGAGLSAWAGYPQWTELLHRLVDYISDRGDGTPAEKARAEEIVNIHENPLKIATQLGGMITPYDFAAFISEQLGPREPRSSAIVRLVASFPFRHFLTLNLDPTLYDALVLNSSHFETFTWYQTNGVIKFLKSLHSGSTPFPRQLIHWHGRYSDPLVHIALATEGYNKLYGQDMFKSFLLTMALTQRLVFIGFGFNDKNFMEPFRIAAQQLGQLDLGHFAIVPFADNEQDQKVRNRYRDEWCVEPIFYPKQKATDGHGGYGKFATELQVIAEALKIPKPSTEIPTKIVTPDQDPEDVALAQSLTESTLTEIKGDGDV